MGQRSAQILERPLALAHGELVSAMRPLLALLGLVALALPMAAHAGPPFVTDDPEPVDYGYWEINNAVMSRAVAGGTQGASLIDANYGALPGLQLHVQPQLAYVRTSSGSHFG